MPWVLEPFCDCCRKVANATGPVTILQDGTLGIEAGIELARHGAGCDPIDHCEQNGRRYAEQQSIEERETKARRPNEVNPAVVFHAGGIPRRAQSRSGSAARPFDQACCECD